MDFNYTPAMFRPIDASDKEIDPKLVKLNCSFGFDALKRSNIHFVDDQTIVYAVGNVLVLQNLRTMEQRYVPGFRDASFSAIAVHPSKRYIAVAEGCSAAMAVPPNIYVLAYPELEVARLLRNGTSRSYADLCFDGVGDTLASVGGDPDYMLTIWSWRSEKVVLRNKAFSQDVFRVAFSPDAEGQLTTSGMGHIKFWKVASTFTGLKLQGLLGKFGVSELTDISSFVAFPDGKVLSSTETGNLLLWDGGMIKCEIAAKGVSSGEGAKKRGGCHAGKVEVVMLFDQEIVTAGDDGVVKVWDFEMVDAADVTTNYGPAGSGGGGGEEQGGQGGNSGGGMNQVRIFEIEPVDELPIGKDVKVKHMVRSPTTPSEYLLQDSLGGHVFRIDTHKRTTDKILSFHAGPVVACDTSPLGHALASLGDDGTLRIWDYITTRSCIAKLRLGNPEEPSSTHGTCLQYLPTSLDPLGCTVITGSNDGVIRIITHTPFPPPKDGKQPQACSLYLQFVFKPHAGGLSAIEVSADGTVLATGGEDGTIFFFGIEKSHGVGVQHGLGAPSAVPKWDFAPVEEGGQGGVKFTPIGFVKAESPPVRISFSPDNSDGFENDEEEEDEEEVDGEEGEDGDKKPEDGERRESNESVDAKGTSANRRKLLVVLRNGEMFTMISPDAQKVDSSLTFEIHSDAVDMKQWEVSVPIKKPVEAPKDPKQQVAQQPPTGVSPSTAPSDQPATAQQEPNETAPTTMIPSTTNLSVPNSMFIEMRKSRGLAIRTGSPIVNAIYLEGGYAILAFTNTNGEGELRVCRLKHPDRSRLLLVYKSPISTIRITTSAKYIVVGSVDGMVGLRKLRLEDIEWTQKFQPTEHEQFAKFLERLEAESQDTKSSGQNLEQVQGEGPAQDIDPTDSIGDLLRAQSRGKMAENEPAGHYWLGYPHGCRYGTVSMIATSFDDSYLLSAGNDGGLFSFRVTFEDVQRSELWEEPEVATRIEDIAKNIEDVVDPTTYTIQEFKIKSEKDRELASAEARNQATREYIQELREEFLKLLLDNQKAGEKITLPREAFKIDPNLQTDMETAAEERIRLVRKELEWISEKESIGPNKLKEKFLDPIQTEKITICAFKSDRSISTFVTQKLDEAFNRSLQPLLKNEVDSHKPRDARGPGRDAQSNTDTTTGQTGQEPLTDKAENETERNRESEEAHNTNGEATVNARKILKPADARSKLESRKEQRLERQSQWKQLAESKPDSTYEDPRDVAAIRYAETHMGDYKLKTGEKYIVPESERVDADKKKRQILLLKESVYTLKEQFNHKVFSLRKHKEQLIEEFGSLNNEVRGMDSRLRTYGVDVDEDLWMPMMEASAHPERRFIVTDEDVIEYKRAEAEHALMAKAAGDDSNMFGTGKAAAPPPPKETKPSASKQEKSNDEVASEDSKDTTEGEKAGTPEDKTRSAMEIREETTSKKILMFQKEQVLRKVESAVAEFDDVVDSMIKERIVLKGDLKFAEIKLLLLHREWVLLKEFEKHDNFLGEKLSLKRNEKKEIDGKIQECQEKLNAKKLEIEILIRKEKDVQREFSDAIGDNNKYEELLTKIFKKRIKRTKKRAKAEASGDQGGGQDVHEAESEEEDSESDDGMDSSDDGGSFTSENDGDGEEVCPSDCDPGLFSRVQDLREKKLDLEDMLAEIQKAIEALKKENDTIVKKEKIIDTGLKAAEAEIQEFQTQKQHKLNELDVVVPLRLHQIQFLDRNAMPADLTSALVFVSNGLSKLRNRIKELQQEKADIRKQHKELKKMHISLIKSRKEKQLRLQDLEDRALNVQMLKFGQTIDLEKLERMGVNKNADELREKLQKEDNKRLAELHSVEGEINRLKEELTEITKENTSRMESLVSLTEQQQRLEDSLNHSQSTVTAEYSGPLKKDMIERQKLIELVRTQNGEIEALRREIDFLIRKPIRPPSMNRTMAPPVRKSVIGYSRPLLPQISELRPSRGDFFEEENMNEPNAQQEHFEDGSENVVPVSAEMTDVPQSSQSDAGGEVLESAES